tara:strand:- start:430 stop:693 length:264 start_codon:yes stop_codon:yes gene_type:complete
MNLFCDKYLDIIPDEIINNIKQYLHNYYIQRKNKFINNKWILLHKNVNINKDKLENNLYNNSNLIYDMNDVNNIYYNNLDYNYMYTF